jgi:prevent-host-death family protein
MDEVSVGHRYRLADSGEFAHGLVAFVGPAAHISTSPIDRSKSCEIMREVQASEAKTHLPQLLDEVEHGETIVITRHGRRIARLVPDSDRRLADAREAVAAIRALRKGAGKITVEELLTMRDEGRK